MTGRAHIVLVLITAGMLGFVLHLVRSGRLRAKYAMLWSTVGAGLVVLAAFPGLLDWTSRHLGIYYPPAAFLTAAVAFLLGLAIHFSWELSRLEERTRALAEEVALLNERLRQLAAETAPVNGRDDGHAADDADADGETRRSRSPASS